MKKGKNFDAMAWGDRIRDEQLDELIERSKDSQTVLLRIDQFRDLVLQAKAPRPEEKPTEREKEAMACLQHARTEIQSAYSAGKMRADLTAKTWAWLHRIDALFSPLDAPEKDYPSRWLMRHVDGEEWETEDSYTQGEITKGPWKAQAIRRL